MRQNVGFFAQKGHLPILAHRLMIKAKLYIETTHPRELRTIPNTNGDIIVFGRTLSGIQKIE